MAPRPSMGVPAPRAMPPYKYATGVRNPNPQVVQPALQQVRQQALKKNLSPLHHSGDQSVYWISSTVVFIWSFPGPASCARSGPGASHRLHVGCRSAARAETDARWALQNHSKQKKPCTYGCCLFPFCFLFFTNRWASLPADSVHACQPGREDHWHAAGDRQLRVVAHVGVSRVSALKGTNKWRTWILKAHFIVLIQW